MFRTLVSFHQRVDVHILSPISLQKNTANCVRLWRLFANVALSSNYLTHKIVKKRKSLKEPLTSVTDIEAKHIQLAYIVVKIIFQS